MREQLLNDELRRDDAHGAVELPPPPLSDHGAGAQVALAGGAPKAGGPGAEPVVEYSVGPSESGALPTGPNVGQALKSLGRAKAALGPDTKLYGREQ